MKLPRERPGRDRFAAEHAPALAFGQGPIAFWALLGRRRRHAAVELAVSQVDLNHAPNQFLFFQGELLSKDVPKRLGDDQQAFDFFLQLQNFRASNGRPLSREDRFVLGEGYHGSGMLIVADFTVW